jgi:hypothetical protein
MLMNMLPEGVSYCCLFDLSGGRLPGAEHEAGDFRCGCCKVMN